MTIFSKIGKFFTKSNWGLAVLVIAILIAFAYLVSNKNQNNPSGPQPTPTPRPLTLQDQQVLSQNKQRLVSQLPYISSQFTVEYFPDRDYFFIQIQRQPYEQNKALAQEWMKQNGVDPDRVNIQWGSVRGAGPRQ